MLTSRNRHWEATMTMKMAATITLLSTELVKLILQHVVAGELDIRKVNSPTENWYS